MMIPFSLYVHIPFCFHKCPYCDFNTYAVASVPEKEYLSGLLSELDYRASRAEWRDRPLQSVFFGGGTPSLFSPAGIEEIIRSAYDRFPRGENGDGGIEVSLEANPGTVSAESLAGFRAGGVNRLSIGAQSFHGPTLKTLGRIHSPDQTDAAVADAREVGFTNVSIDLMYGIPGQSEGDLREDLIHAVDLEPDHVSLYSLTIEKGTPYYQSHKKGVLKLPPERAVLSMMDEMEGYLPSNRLRRYEISNYAKPGFEARHNLAYWNGDDYLGLGAGAHSFLRVRDGDPAKAGLRWSNYALPAKYVSEATATGHADSWNDTLTARDAAFEYFFLGLRKIDGVTLSGFEERFGRSARECYGPVLDLLTRDGLLVPDGDRVALSPRGLRLADSVIEYFAPAR